jgi:hypothetical protein
MNYCKTHGTYLHDPPCPECRLERPVYCEAPGHDCNHPQCSCAPPGGRPNTAESLTRPCGGFGGFVKV